MRNADISITRGATQDVCHLLRICRASFPHSVRWQGQRQLGERWWESVLSCSGAETWLCSVGGDVAGFIVLVTDGDEWGDTATERQVSWFWAVLSAIQHPNLLVSQFRKKLRLARVADETVKRTNEEGGIYGKRLRVELLAVKPEMRGKGLARRMMNHCQIRARDICADAIQLTVDPGNTVACKLYEAMGFIHIKSGRSGLVFRKRIGQHC